MEMWLVVLEKWDVEAMWNVASWEMHGAVQVAVETGVEHASPGAEVVAGMNMVKGIARC